MTYRDIRIPSLGIVSFLETILDDKVLSNYVKNIRKYQKIYDDFLHEVEHTLSSNIKMICAEYQNKAIKEFINNEKNVAFFCPTKSFRSNFGNIPDILEKNKIKVLYFYGEICNDDFENNLGSFYISDMNIERYRLDMVDCIVTASIMDCLPNLSKKILIDHISFVQFLPYSQEYIEDEINLKNFIDLKGYKPVLQPLYDYQFVSSKFVLEQALNESILNGYLPENYSDIQLEKSLTNKYIDSIFTNLKHLRIVNKTVLVNTGYLKINKYIEYMKNKDVKNMIVYAPTPNDNDNKKTWTEVMTINEYGSELITALCKSFPNYEIVFKPYIDEEKKIVQKIVNDNSIFSNFRFVKQENTMKLYSEAKIMISDLSSTAFTFSLSTLRPTLFFSPNDNLFDDKILDLGNYIKNRERVGIVCKSINALVDDCQKLIHNIDFFEKEIKILRNNYLYNINDTENVISESILEVLYNKPITCENISLTRKEV